ncbi:MAG: AAA family ATPase, partial [Pseudomonadota bacterium]
MKFTNIRLVGFKSFVEPTDFEIRDGLTGVVGPNGCGKSNVLEALRWVMGATSAKALRGAAMDAVIFSGTSMRPARNWAEVVLTLDNSDRSAPAEYNEAATLEVSRRIIRKEDGAHSVYRINNKEVRAKDVQLLFADASTGANSPALVRQGQVGDLINAKPQNRRRLLEEAAGVTGLHSRRHEAELRLRAAEQNLERLDDVMGELEAQKGALARQARQATRYRNVSGDIRRSEAMLAHLRWREATDALSDASTGLEEIGGRIAETASAAAAASTQQEDAHSALDPLRMREAEDAAALHRLNVARDGLDDEARRAAAEIDRLTSEISRLGGDRDREHDLLADADNAIAALSQEEETLKAREASEAERLTAAAAHMQEASDALDQAERAFEAQSSEAADIDAKRRAIADAIAGAERRLTKINSQIQDLSEERDLITPSPEEAAALEAAKARFEAVSNAAQHAEAAFQRAEDEKRAAEQRESELRGPLRQAEQTQTEIDAERDALRRVLAADGADDWRPLLEMVSVEAGYESALAAALGDDLSASTDEAAPARWTRLGDAAIDLPLPFGAEPLSRFVRAPAQLTRRLASVGVIAAEDGARLSASLKPGQRLVSTAGDVWRWDGFAAKADAKTAAAVRLEQRNRLIVLERDHEDTVARARAAAQAHESAVAALKTTQDNERAARAAFVDAGRAVDKARTALSELEREHERASTRRGAIEDHLA